MRILRLILLIYILLNCILQNQFAQSQLVLNPSFDGYIGQGFSPFHWFGCDSLTTLDTRPYYNDMPPTDGNTYLGMVMRGLMDTIPKNEEASTKLLKPLRRDSIYILTIDAAFLPHQYDVFSATDTLYYKNPSRFRILAGNDSCTMNEVLGVSELITDLSWKKHFFEIIPKIDGNTFLEIEIYLDTMRASYILLDNLTFEQLGIYGEDTVCQGEQNIVYHIPNINCVTNAIWHYTGSGVALTNLTDSLIIDFDSTATSGVLSVNFLYCGLFPKTFSLPITVEYDSLSGLGKIIGLSEVCENQWQINYTIDKYPNDRITWSYSGNLVSINNYYTDSVFLNFPIGAESGILTVSGKGACKSVLPVNVLPLPSNATLITGDNEVCKNQSGVLYTIPAIKNAANYIWEYFGTGVNINGNTDSITIDFTERATWGALSVKGENGCGTGSESSWLFIDVDSVPSNDGAIYGNYSVCEGWNDNFYSVSEMYNADEFHWEYSGTGARINGNTYNAEIDFLNDATSGILSVSGTNKCGTSLTPVTLPISIMHLPEDAGNIIGDTLICLNETEILYQVPAIGNATNYIWSIRNYGEIYNDNSNTIRINSYQLENPGYLWVVGQNNCGSGMPSPELKIAVRNIPEAINVIDGDEKICFNSTSEYFVVPDKNISSYLWNYSGKNVLYSDSSNSASINFIKIENSGILTVAGINECGIGKASNPLVLEVGLCDLHIPNTFTPNDDNVNELFYIRDLPENSKLVVFDRSGKLVYQSENYNNDWDGTDLNGEILKTDTYWYILSIEGIESDYKGFIYLKQ
jgi:gliding motility-associated-like protein